MLGEESGGVTEGFDGSSIRSMARPTSSTASPPSGYPWRSSRTRFPSPAAIHAPFLGDTWHAARGAGAIWEPAGGDAGTVSRVRASAGTGGGRDGIPLPPEGPASEVSRGVHRGRSSGSRISAGRAPPVSISPGRRAASSTVSSSSVSDPGTSRQAGSWWKKPAGASPIGAAAPAICRATSWPARPAVHDELRRIAREHGPA